MGPDPDKDGDIHPMMGGMMKRRHEEDMGNVLAGGRGLDHVRMALNPIASHTNPGVINPAMQNPKMGPLPDQQHMAPIEMIAMMLHGQSGLKKPQPNTATSFSQPKEFGY